MRRGNVDHNICREIERDMQKGYDNMRSLLAVALAEHDDHHGEFAPDFMPHHWTHQARKLLTERKRINS